VATEAQPAKHTKLLVVEDALVARDIGFVFVRGYGDHGLPAYRDRPTLRKPFQIDALKRALQERLGTE
jgi:hypothetical protein